VVVGRFQRQFGGKACVQSRIFRKQCGLMHCQSLQVLRRLRDDLGGILYFCQNNTLILESVQAVTPLWEFLSLQKVLKG
jgi:hypothetical protein